MGTLADKIAYLSDTKVAIRDSLVQAGVEVPIGTTFREYANIIASNLGLIDFQALYIDNNEGFTESVSPSLQADGFYGGYETVKNGYGIICGVNFSDLYEDNYIYIYNESTKSVSSFLTVGSNRPQVLCDWETGKPILINDDILLICSNPFNNNNIMSKLNVTDLSTVTNVATPINASLSNMGLINNGNGYMIPNYIGWAEAPSAQVFKYTIASNTISQIMYDTAINSFFGSTAASRINMIVPLSGIQDKCLAFVYNGTTFGVCQLDLTVENSISSPYYIDTFGGNTGYHTPIVTNKYIYIFPSANVGGSDDLTVVRIRRDQELSASSYDNVLFKATGSANTERNLLSYGFLKQVSIKKNDETIVGANSLFIPKNCVTLGNITKTLAVDTVKQEFSIIYFSSQSLYDGLNRDGGSYEVSEDYCGYSGFGEDVVTSQPLLLSYWRIGDGTSHNINYLRNKTVIWHSKFSKV